MRRVEEAIDLDVAKLLDGSDLPAVESGDEDLEEDFVILANQSDEEQQIEEEEKNIGGGKEKAQQQHREQFDSVSPGAASSIITACQILTSAADPLAIAVNHSYISFVSTINMPSMVAV
jgi:hypothetical protein